MHIGAAFRKYLVSIWGNTVPDFGMYPYMPGDEDKFYISQVDNLRCRPCSKLGYKKCPKNHFKCMMEQNVDDIVGIISEFWKKSKTEKA
jgi:ADP-heptose:LPS heptosyltransferase